MTKSEEGPLRSQRKRVASRRAPMRSQLETRQLEKLAYSDSPRFTSPDRPDQLSTRRRACTGSAQDRQPVHAKVPSSARKFIEGPEARVAFDRDLKMLAELRPGDRTVWARARSNRSLRTVSLQGVKWR